MAWRVANSLLKLREQVDAAWPNRNRASDGTIGDAAHAASTSDHNPWIQDGGVGVVTALDITHDPASGCDCNRIADRLVESCDPRIKYIIWNHRIISSVVSPWVWRPYSGSNPHDKHLHLSVHSSKSLYDSTQAWQISKPEPRRYRFELTALDKDGNRRRVAHSKPYRDKNEAARRRAFKARHAGRIVWLTFQRRRPDVRTVRVSP